MKLLTPVREFMSSILRRRCIKSGSGGINFYGGFRISPVTGKAFRCDCGMNPRNNHRRAWVVLDGKPEEVMEFGGHPCSIVIRGNTAAIDLIERLADAQELRWVRVSSAAHPESDQAKPYPVVYEILFDPILSSLLPEFMNRAQTADFFDQLNQDIHDFNAAKGGKLAREGIPERIARGFSLSAMEYLSQTTAQEDWPALAALLDGYIFFLHRQTYPGVFETRTEQVRRLLAHWELTGHPGWKALTRLFSTVGREKRRQYDAWRAKYPNEAAQYDCLVEEGQAYRNGDLSMEDQLGCRGTVARCQGSPDGDCLVQRSRRNVSPLPAFCLDPDQLRILCRPLDELLMEAMAGRWTRYDPAAGLTNPAAIALVRRGQAAGLRLPPPGYTPLRLKLEEFFKPAEEAALALTECIWGLETGQDSRSAVELQAAAEWVLSLCEARLLSARLQPFKLTHALDAYAAALEAPQLSVELEYNELIEEGAERIHQALLKAMTATSPSGAFALHQTANPSRFKAKVDVEGQSHAIALASIRWAAERLMTNQEPLITQLRHTPEPIKAAAGCSQPCCIC